MLHHPEYPFMFTPHARGSTLNHRCQSCWSRVYPACAGIDPPDPHYLPPRGSLPRMRGDRPYRTSTVQVQCKFTPHARGSTWVDRIIQYCRDVYPACAGIDPFFIIVIIIFMRLPRMRGDRP